MTKPERPLKRLRQRLSWRKVLGGFLIVAALFGGYFGIKLLLATKDIITQNLSGGADFGDEPVNVLVMGVGGPGHDGPNLADTILVVSIDPKTKVASMLSVPRDFYVRIPENGWSKINAVNVYGEESRRPGGGPALMKRTLGEILGIPIHYYVKMDFSGFRQLVDAVGGVDITVEKAIYDPFFPADRGRGYKPFRISAGRHHMDGDTALRYARSRETTSDFDRAKRQQQVILAIREKALSAGTLANPKRVNDLIEAIGDHVRTDMQLGEIRQFLELAESLDTGKTQSAVLDPATGVVRSSTIGGAYVLVPTSGLGKYGNIQAWVEGYLIKPYLEAELAALSISNGTGIAGLAAEAAASLKERGFRIADTGNAVSPESETKIIDYTGGKKPHTVRLLRERLRADSERRPAAEAPEGIDIQIIIGADFRRSYLE